MDKMESNNWFTVEQWVEDLNRWICLFGYEDELVARHVYGVLQEASPNSKYRVKTYSITEYEKVVTNESSFNAKG